MSDAPNTREGRFHDIPQVQSESMIATDANISEDGNESDDEWLARKYFEETCLQGRTVWDIYMKYFTVFLTINVTALGVVAQYLEPANRGAIVWAFIGHNLITMTSSLAVGIYSRSVTHNLRSLSHVLQKNHVPSSRFQRLMRASPFPGNLGLLCGIANALGNLMLIICWICVLSIKTVSTNVPPSTPITTSPPKSAEPKPSATPSTPIRPNTLNKPSSLPRSNP